MKWTGNGGAGHLAPAVTMPRAARNRACNHCPQSSRAGRATEVVLTCNVNRSSHIQGNQHPASPLHCITWVPGSGCLPRSAVPRAARAVSARATQYHQCFPTLKDSKMWGTTWRGARIPNRAGVWFLFGFVWRGGSL